MSHEAFDRRTAMNSSTSRVVAALCGCLVSLPPSLHAAGAELSTAISRGITQKFVAVPPVKTTETEHFRISARNDGATGVNVPLQITFPQQLLPSGGRGDGFSC